MAMQIERVVDAHVHLWDPARTDWYPHLSIVQDVGGGDFSKKARYFDQRTYFAESARWNVDKFVHVSATASCFIDETAELEGQAQTVGHPDAIIGGIVPGCPAAEAIDQLDQQMASPHFRGVRPMGGEMEGAVPNTEILAALQERDLVFDMMAHADQLAAAAVALSDWGKLTVVIEHAGWPRSNTDEEYQMWKEGMSSLASLGPNVHCKLSGLAMPLASIEPASFRPWIEHCLEVFGVDRCFFASNFPVDSMHGTFDELYTTYSTLTADLDAESRRKLFATNAERLYRC